MQDIIIGRLFPSTISEWKILDCKIRNSGRLSVFKKNLLNFIHPCGNSIFNINKPNGIKLLTRLLLDLSHFRDHKFRHCFQDTLNPLCDCGNELKRQHTFLHCPSFHTPGQNPLEQYQKNQHTDFISRRRSVI